jgi:hypothetical protein
VAEEGFEEVEGETAEEEEEAGLEVSVEILCGRVGRLTMESI